MRYFLVLAAVGAMASMCVPVHSQTPSTSSKREVCKTDAKALRGDRQEKVDQYELCLVQARMDCLKEAIAKKVTGSDRREYLKKCVGTRGDDNKI